MIPQLNSELIDEKITGFYIDWIQDIHNQEAMELKAQLDRDDQPEVSSIESSSNVISNIKRNDPGYKRAQKARALIFKKINDRRATKQEGSTSNKQIQYKQVVSEFVAGPGIIDFLRDFMGGRI